MANYYVDDGGDGSTESSWATAATSINALDSEYALTYGDNVYFGHDSVCQATNTASLVVTGPSASVSVINLISATRGSDPPAYQASTTAQIDTSEAATYDLTFDGSFALWGLSVKAGRHVKLVSYSVETFFSKESRFALGANASLMNGYGNAVLYDTVIDLTQDGTTSRSASVVVWGGFGMLEMRGISFVNPGYRTGPVFSFYNLSQSVWRADISGGDLSGFPASTPIVDAQYITGPVVFDHMILPVNATLWNGAYYPLHGGSVMFVNCSSANEPSMLATRDYRGGVTSKTTVYRNGGGEVEGAPWAWLLYTSSVAREAAPLKTPWIYGEFDSTGNKTVSLYITNETADFTDAEVVLEIEAMETANEAQFSLSSNARTVTATGAAHADDTTSTWTGVTGTYKQVLSCAVAVGQAGQFRVRVCVGVASLATSRSFYVDPKVVVA